VWQDQAFAAHTLDAELSGRRLDPRDARLATELVYGVLRTRRVLEQRLDAHANRRGYKRKPAILAPLLIGAYSVLFLERIPTHAAVDEAVRGVRTAGDRRVAGFANAVLRKLAAERERDGPGDLDEAFVAATPPWLRASLARTVGDRAARALVTGEPVAPQGICLGAGQDRAAWLAELRRAVPKAVVEPWRLSPQCILLAAAGDLRRLPGAGVDWIAQEEGAQVVALALGARQAESVLDACAGRGGKSFVLADAVGAEGAVDAADRSPAKLERLLRAPPHGARLRHTFAVDWSRGSGEVPAGYDRALVDAPCSGVGTLRRRPEIAARLTVGDPARLGALQVAIVRRVATRVRTGGRLVFAVCSVLAEETDGVVDALCARGSEGGDWAAVLEPCPFDSPLVRELSAGASRLRLLPAEHGTDGYFMASFVVRRP
jgi:16S rRNA (cytosine967-C5)-methyltransferase